MGARRGRPPVGIYSEDREAVQQLIIELRDDLALGNLAPVIEALNAERGAELDSHPVAQQLLAELASHVEEHARNQRGEFARGLLDELGVNPLGAQHVFWAEDRLHLTHDLSGEYPEGDDGEDWGRVVQAACGGRFDHETVTQVVRGAWMDRPDSHCSQCAADADRYEETQESSEYHPFAGTGFDYTDFDPLVTADIASEMRLGLRSGDDPERLRERANQSYDTALHMTLAKMASSEGRPERMVRLLTGPHYQRVLRAHDQLFPQETQRRRLGGLIDADGFEELARMHARGELLAGDIFEAAARMKLQERMADSFIALLDP